MCYYCSAPPKIQGCGEYSVSEGEQVNAWLSVTGFPYPEISWTFNGKDVSGDKDIKLMSGGNYHLLGITETARKHHGTYKLTAVNKAGKDTKTVLVHGKFVNETTKSCTLYD